jgi:hypothetical protein
MLLDFLYVRSALLKHNPANQKGVEGGTRLCQYQKAGHHCRSFRKDKKEKPDVSKQEKGLAERREDKKRRPEIHKVERKKNHTTTSSTCRFRT